MRTILRGLRGIRRSPLRAGLLAGLLAVSIGLSLIMLVVNTAFTDHIEQIRSEVGTDISLSPIGLGQTMLEANLESLAMLPHVSNVTRKLSNQYTGETLTPVIQSNVLQSRGIATEQASAVVRISVIGSDSPDALITRDRRTTGLGVTIQPSEPVTIVTGRTFTAAEIDANVAVISQTLAEANELSVGFTIDLNDTPVEIIGMFETAEGDFLSNNVVFLPLDTAQRIFNQPDSVSQVTVYVDDVDNVDAIATAISSTLEDLVDITTNTAAFDGLAAPLENAQNGSKTGLIAALAASAIVILFAMFQAVRSCIKEIGILKAIGASNGNVALQFGIEALVIGLVAAVVGALATFSFAQIVANGLIGSPAPVSNGLPSLGNIEVVVSPIIFVYALGLALGLAILGSCIPAWNVARIKPAEVLRNE